VYRFGQGDLVQLAQLVESVHRVRETSRKTLKIALLAEVLRETTGRETELAALYLSGVLPQGRIGVGWRTVRAAWEAATSSTGSLTLKELDAAVASIASDAGPGSARRRSGNLSALFARVGERERQFLGELLIGELRQGALDGLVLEAIAKAAGVASSAVRQAAMFAPNLGAVARAALEEPASGLARFSLRLLSPVAPMLASPADDVEEAIERLGEAAFEYKLDGARIQVHRDGEEVRVFTRQLQDVTDRVPEIVDWARDLPVTRLVLEGETLALREDGRPHPFQVTMRRLGRSKGVEAARRALPLSWFFFDCLYLGGDGSLISATYAERFVKLAQVVDDTRLLPRIVTANAEDAQAFLQRSLDAGHEGLMAKSLSGPYVAGQRGFHWIKLKRAQTLDLVVLAAEWGSGRRKGWLSNLHLGARDAESGQFVMLGKTFKGLTDEMLRWQTERLLALQTEPGEWVVPVRPELVVEVAFGGVQESPRYPAGLALRFARVKGFRTDKTADDADTLESVRRIFEAERA
jgi:DNA ligase-1